MASKLQSITALSQRTALNLASDFQIWSGFLKTAAWNYKYPFQDQLLIYAQRPDATACASFDVWNQKLHRYINKGAKGIALIDDSKSSLSLHYVYDISDTNSRENRPVSIWHLNENIVGQLNTYLSDSFDLTFNDVFIDTLKTLAESVADDMADGYFSDLLQSTENSLLEGLDEFNVNKLFKDCLVSSVSYMLLDRCGYDPAIYFDAEDFKGIENFNTIDTVSMLGAAISDASETILREIGSIVKKIERENRQKQGVIENERTDIQNGRGLSDSQPGTGNIDGRNSDREVRDDAENISEGTQERAVRQPDGEERIDASSGNDRQDSERESGSDRGSDGEGEYATGQSGRSDGLGGAHEYAENDGGGNRAGRSDLPVNPDWLSAISKAIKEDPEHILVINTDRYGYVFGDHAESVSQILGVNLAHGGNFSFCRFPAENLNDAIVQLTEKGHSVDVTKMIELSGPFTSIEIERSRRAELDQLSIYAALRNDRFMRHKKDEVVAFFLEHESPEERADFMRSCYDNTYCQLDRTGSLGHVKTEEGKLHLWSGNFLTRTAEAFLSFDEVQERVSDMIQEHTYLSTPEYSLYPSVEEQSKVVDGAMTSQSGSVSLAMSQEDIDHGLCRGSGVVDGKHRIYEFLRTNPAKKDAIEFLKNEYGTGGGTVVYPDGVWGFEDHDFKGIKLNKGKSMDKSEVHLSWDKVYHRINELIAMDRYLNGKELAEHPAYLAELEVRKERASFADELKAFYDPFTENRIENHNRVANGVSFYELTMKINSFYVYNDAEAKEFLAQNLKTILDSDVSEEERTEATRLLDKLSGYMEPMDKEVPAEEEIPTETVVSYKVGDTFYMGSADYTIIGIGDVVTISDNSFPLNTKDFAKDEFDKLVLRFIANEHLTKEVPAKEQGVVRTKEQGVGSSEELVVDSEAISSEGEKAPTDKNREDAAFGERFADDSAVAYELGFGHLGNGITVWNRLKEVHGDYQTVAHISADREITYYDKDMPESVKQKIIDFAEKENPTISATQSAPVFHTFAGEPVREQEEPSVDEDKKEQEKDRGSEGQINLPDSNIVKEDIDEPRSIYRYYSTQRPIDLGTYPNPVGNKPITIENYDSRQLVENDSFQAWGYLEYKQPLTQAQIAEYELRESVCDNRENVVESEVLYLLDNEMYLHVQFASDGDIDYTLYGDEPIHELDGGQFELDEEIDLSHFDFDDVLPEIFEMHDLKPVTIVKQSIDELERLQESDQQFVSARVEEIQAEAVENEAKKEFPNTVAHQNYKFLQSFAPEILNGEYSYMRFESEGYEPLSIERIGGNTISVMHTYVQNGDLMRDPDVTLVIDNENQTVNARSYELSSLAVYQEVEDYETHEINHSLESRLNSFFRDWMKNVDEQDFSLVKATAVRDGEDIDFVVKDGVLVPEKEMDIKQDKLLFENEEVEVEEYPVEKYEVGQSVYLDGTEFKITEIRDHNVHLLDPALAYPIFRVESKEDFEELLKQDTRNGGITEFLAEELDHDLESCLVGVGGLFDQRDKEIISEYFRKGLGNTQISKYLSEFHAGKEGSMDDYIDSPSFAANTVSFVIHLKDENETEKRYKWGEIVPFLRTMYEQEKYGFTKEVSAREQIYLEGTPSYDIGTPVILDMGDRILRGKVGNIGDTSVRVDTTPYSWSNEVLDKDHFEEILRRDERNAHLFSEKQEKVHAGNFHITDFELGAGGPKVKYANNIAAIRLLKQLEVEDRMATPAEQDVLSKYVGWGGVSMAFDPKNNSWASEYRELKELLTEDEYKAARESTLTAYYTSPVIIDAMYQKLSELGFKTGNILEPSCGVGNFLGMLPENMKSSKMYGVELDQISGRIAKQLYQDSNIAVQGYEETALPDSFFDVAIGNVPFGQFKVLDKRYDKHNFMIHDYFFAKTLDKVRPGGVIAFITSKGTMDKMNPSVRKYIAQRADLLGAIRLPNTAFQANAGTEATADILFLQKRDRIIDIEPDWVHLDYCTDSKTGQVLCGADGEPFKINSYFAQHPQMVLGNMVVDRKQYGREDITCEPIEGADLATQLKDAMKHITGQMQEMERDDEPFEKDIVSIPADPNVRNFSYTIVDGQIYFRENSVMNLVDASKARTERIKGLIELRDCVQDLINFQTWNYDDETIQAQQERLNTLYDTYTEKYGLISSRGNSMAFSDDSSYYLLCSLEILDDEGQLKEKSAMFTKRTIGYKHVATHVDTPVEALAVSISEKAKVDLEYMKELTGMSFDELTDGLTGVIFPNPERLDENGVVLYETADEYLSGNVREKLRVAREYAEIDPDKYGSNVAALEKTQPIELGASDISVRLGSTWIEPRFIDQFVHELLEPSDRVKEYIKVTYSDISSTWNIAGKNFDRGNVKANNTYGSFRASAYKIIEDTLNLKDVRVYDYEYDDEGRRKQILNQKETTVAQLKQEAIKEAFSEWIWKDPERRNYLVKKYNEMFNNMRPREYDGSHITFNNMNPEISLMPHQKNAVAHVMYGGNALLGHVVGAGKTFAMTAAAMEMKRLGLAEKSMFAVPNHLTEQWAADILRLYPSANVLVATKKDFETKNRKKFCGRIATGEYDAVIIGHSQFEKIPMSVERQKAMLEEEIETVTNGIAELKESQGEQFSIKQMEKTRKSLKARLDKLNDDSRKDDVVTFEQLGVDRLFVDEAHYYKNLFLYTKMRNVGGLAQTEAQKSSDLYMKTRYLSEMTDNRGVIFATGTPISNSMTELYTMQRYLQYDLLCKLNLQHFDSWASTFGETVTAIELAPEGTGYRAKTRFSKFYNLPELMNIFKNVADIQTADMLDLPVPKANFHNVALKPSEFQKSIVADLSERADRVRNKQVDSTEDNMLKITNDGRKLALDQRLINPLLPDDENGKVSVCADNVFDIWEKTMDNKSAQLVFCDLSTPHNDGAFNVYDDLKQKLMNKGIPEEQIAFIHDANTDKKKEALFENVREGSVRVLVGSTFKMGAGTNVQDRLIALHDLDCPWRPSDLEQRLGRIVRQGNTNPEVDIFRYVTEGTFDAYLYQLVENKQRFISQIMTSKSPVRSAEDIDEASLSYAEIKALATGNPLIKEKMDLDITVSRLKTLKSNYLNQKYALEDKLLQYYPKKIKETEENIKLLKSDIETVKKFTVKNEDGISPMQIGNCTYTVRKDAGAALLSACTKVKDNESIKIGTYRGLDLSVKFSGSQKGFWFTVGKESIGRSFELGQDAVGNIVRIDNAITEMLGSLPDLEAKLDDLHKQRANAEIEVKKPFVKEEELKTKLERLAELNILLDQDSKEHGAISNDSEIIIPNAEQTKKDITNMAGVNMVYEGQRQPTLAERIAGAKAEQTAQLDSRSDVRNKEPLGR